MAAAKKKTVKKKATKKVAKKATKKVAKKATKQASKKVAKKVVKSAVTVSKDKPFTKTQFLGAVSDMAGLTRVEVSRVFEAMQNVIGAHLKKGGPGNISLMGLFKVKVVKKPATKARKGVNPFTGAEMMFKAKPASRKAKILPLKQLKDMAS